MPTKQINLKLPTNIAEAAERHVKEFGFRNIQDLILESMRDKIFLSRKKKNSYEEFLHKIQQPKMKELWNNKEDEAWEYA